MKRKKTNRWLSLIISLSACFICLGAAIVLEYLTDTMSDSVNAEKITTLISQRTDAMNGYFEGENTFHHASEILYDVEMGDLLEEDLFNLQAYERTDIETVEYYEIRDVVMVNQGENDISARVTVDWTVYGLEGLDVLTATYNVVCKKDGETLKLVEFF